MALVSWLPSIRVGPSRYFSVLSWLQANSGWSETSVTCRSPQVKLAKPAWSASVGCQSIALSGGVPWPSAGWSQACRGLRRGGGQRGHRAVVARRDAPRRAGRRARRAGRGAPSAGSPTGRSGVVARRSARPVGAVGRLDGAAADLLGGVDRPEAQHGGLADQPDELVLLDVGDGDDDLLVAGGRDLGLADAEAVDPALDDGLRQLQAGRVDRARAGGVLGGQGDGRAAPEVEPQLGRPGVRRRPSG